jgi:signal transduction histidine kinase
VGETPAVRLLATLDGGMASELSSDPQAKTALRRSDLVVDVGVALVVFAASLALLVGRGNEGAGSRSLDALGVVLAAFASLPLVARRRAPLAVFVVTAAASALLNGLGYPPGPPLGPTVALFFLALQPEKTRNGRLLTLGLVVGMAIVHAGAVGVAEGAFPAAPLLFGVLVWGGAWVAGDRVRMRRERIAELEERARRGEREAERERRLAAAEERTRIARDLHDSAGHAINVILVQAGAARLLGERDPARSRAAVETIEEVARETLGEIDQLVRALRDDEPVGGVVEPPLGLDAIQALVERHRSAGLEVNVETHGLRRPLPPGLDQAAYRILQEGLTNAARHGDGRADVDIDFGASALELAVINPASSSSTTPQQGNGLVGMHERAALLGGTLHVAASDGVFIVRARLPYGDGA